MFRELEIFLGETPLQEVITKVDDIDIGIRTRLTPAMDRLFPSLLVVFIKEFGRSKAVNFSLVIIGEGIRFNAFIGTHLGLKLFLLILDDATQFTFFHHRVFRIIFSLHDGFNLLVFFTFQEVLGNGETRPEFITDTGFHRIATAFSNLNRIFDGSGNMTKLRHHFFFGTEVKTFGGETLIHEAI